MRCQFSERLKIKATLLQGPAGAFEQKVTVLNFSPTSDETEGFYREYACVATPVMGDHQGLSTYDRMT